MKPLAAYKDRLIASVERLLDPPWCLLWTGAKTHDGYGNVLVRRKTLRAHRVMFEIVYGPIPDGLDVLHRCDTPACINPDHLFLGTALDNNADRHAKGRTACGRRKRAAKLSDDVVASILADPRSNAELGRIHGVAPSRISEIRHGLAWRHVTASRQEAERCL